MALDTCQWKRAILINTLLSTTLLMGCSISKPDAPSSRDELRFANHGQALVALANELDEEGKDRFLYLVGAGLIKNLHGDYQESNRNLEAAARLAENLQTKRAGNMLKTALTSPASGDYGGTAYERAYIHYYKALNHIMLAATSQGNGREKNLEGARIEARRVDILLTEIQNTKGRYNQSRDKKDSTFKTLLKLLRGLQGRSLDPSWLVYREDAYIRYMEGVIYEANGEYDNARIAYQKAARLYEQGYAKQYDLGQEITELAWFDTIRMMQWAGGYDNHWPELANTKLSQETKKRLKLFSKGGAQVLVINHAGFIPERKEMSLHLRLDRRSKELIIRPSVISLDIASAFNKVDYSTRNEQLAWFQELYSDRGLLFIVSNFYKSGYHGAISGLIEQRTTIAPLWGLAQSIGLVEGMSGIGTTIEVPYYSSTAPKFGDTHVWIDDKNQGTLTKAESLANIALQEQLLNASTDLILALARELTKVIICANMAKELDDLQAKLAEKICILGWGALSEAETRNWLMLPHTIQLQRFPVDAGIHKVRLVTGNATSQGVYAQHEQQIEVKRGEVYLLVNRALSRPVLHPQLVEN